MLKPLQGLVLGVVILVASACKLDVEVAVDAEPNGSGVVNVTATLDQEAASRTPNLSSQLRVDDLKTVGWSVAGPTTKGTTTVIQASKTFRNPSEATSLLEEISGADGPFGDLRLARERKPLWWEWELEGDLDLKGGIERFGDEGLRTQLEGTSFGVDPKEIQQAINLELAVDLPGQVNAEGAKQSDGQMVWTANFDQTQQVKATSRVPSISRPYATAVAAIALTTLVLLLLRIRKASG